MIKPSPDANIACLVSGGVDSSVALQILCDAGFKPHLFYIEIGMNERGFKDCPAEEDIEMVTWQARHFGLPIERVSLHKEYWDYVVKYTLDTVKKGLTPHPDIMCNRLIKFGFFNDYWGKDFDAIATGHYAGKIEHEGLEFLSTAKDTIKDQTDFLAQISYEQLKKSLFPIGDLPKSEVRAIAEKHKLITAHRKDSQGICFLGKINYNDFLREHLGERIGRIVNIDTGECIGEHKGFWFHTIGQRKGLGLSGGPWFVVKKDAKDNILFVSRGYDPDLQYGNVIDLNELHYISKGPLPKINESIPISFKVRHTPDFTNGFITQTANGFTVRSEEMVQGIAPGQYCCIYSEDNRICYGSGMIVGGRRED